MKTLIDFLYTLLIGAAVALFVALGIWTFYPGPKSPEYPMYNQYGINGPTEEQNKEFMATQEKFDKDLKAYQEKEKTYSKNVGGIALGAAVVFFVAGMWLMRREDVVGEGVALGGIFTGVYAAARSGMGDSRPLVFASVTALLVMVVLLSLYRLRLRESIKDRVVTKRK